MEKKIKTAYSQLATEVKEFIIESLIKDPDIAESAIWESLKQMGHDEPFERVYRYIAYAHKRLGLTRTNKHKHRNNVNRVYGFKIDYAEEILEIIKKYEGKSISYMYYYFCKLYGAVCCLASFNVAVRYHQKNTLSLAS